MRQLKLLGIALVAALSLGVAATTAAQAVELKLLPEKATFKLKSTSTTSLSKLSGGEKVVCESVEGTGEGTSERLGKLDLLFLKCKLAVLGVACTGLGDTVSGSILVEVEWHLRHLLAEPKGVDLVLLIIGDGNGVAGPAHFTCLGILFLVKGCVATNDLLKENNTLLQAGELVTSFLGAFTQSGGDASNSSIATDNGLGMESCVLLAEQEGKGFESSGQEGSGTVEKCTKEGSACTFLIDLSGTL